MKLSAVWYCLVIPIFLQACSSALPEDPKAGTVKAKLVGDDLGTAVHTAKAERKLFNYFIYSNGKIQSLSEELITAEADGKLAICHANPGSRFGKGDLIAKLATNAIDLKIERTQLNLYNSDKEYESQLLGYQNLLRNQDSDLIKKKIRISSGLSMAEQDLKDANYELSKAFIAAPFACRVADVTVHEGEMVRAGQPMFRLYDPDHLVLVVKILEADLYLVKIGMAAEITPLADPDKKVTATVHDINPYIDENGMVSVRLSIQGRNELLFPGMNATAVIDVPVTRSVVVPKEAMVMRNGKPVVFVIENGLAKWRYVTVGRDNGKELEIRDGVHDGEEVITSNNLQLGHDAPVKPDN
jgi:membrane fusion protein (multidrug efflux system)